MPTRNVSYLYLCILCIVLFNSSKAILFSCTCIPIFSSFFFRSSMEKVGFNLEKKLPVISPLSRCSSTTKKILIILRFWSGDWKLSSLCLSPYVSLSILSFSSPHSYRHCIQHCQLNYSLITYAEQKIQVIVSFPDLFFSMFQEFLIFFFFVLCWQILWIVSHNKHNIFCWQF